MATILHLTDLHLSQPSASDALGDYSKAQLLEPAEFQSRKTALEASLDSLGEYLQARGTVLDSIIITGDVTVASEADGFTMLPAFLGHLGDAMVEPDRVLLTPGNHDVQWSTKPGCPERYQYLIELREQAGYRTAYLDGIDINASGTPAGGSTPPCLAGRDGSYVVVGLNSSNHCGVDASVEVDLEEYLALLEDRASWDTSIAVLLKAWRRRGLSDLARLDSPQLLAAGNLWPTGATQSVAAPLRIAALHHQIGPVTDIEEVKQFEMMSNLGAFRKWLVDHSVDVVLHGHTHVAYNRHDMQRPYHSLLSSAVEHRFLVIGGGTVGRGAPHAPVANLITTTPYAARFRPVRIEGLLATTSKKPLSETDFTRESAFVRGDILQASGVITGRNVDEVFEQLLGLDDLATCARPLICRIDDGQSALQLPSSYPDGPVTADVAKGWLKETVSWWQRSPRGPGATFNHGERLKRRDGEELDQIEHAAQVLANDAASSRAVAVLVHPRTDLTDDATFPSFVMLHATITGVGASQQLDIVAYFRKQEIPHWWPVNMAELATIQLEMIGVVGVSRPGIVPGSITSVTSIPVAGHGIPFVAVPWLDRNADKPRELLSLITPILCGRMDDADAAWELAMADWALGNTPPLDGEPVPLEGLETLASLLRGLTDAFGQDQSAAIAALDKSLRSLARENAAYRAAQRGKRRAAKRAKWIDAVNEEREAIRHALADLRAPAR